MARLKVRFYLEQRKIMIRFPNEDKASAYTAKNSNARIRNKDPRRDVYLPLPAGLEYSEMQASQGNEVLVLVFANKDKAKGWEKRSVLGHHRDDREVHIKLKWEDDELDTMLGVGVTKDKVADLKWKDDELDKTLGVGVTKDKVADLKREDDELDKTLGVGVTKDKVAGLKWDKMLGVGVKKDKVAVQKKLLPILPDDDVDVGVRLRSKMPR
jgi:hypothetical protein